jgi:hypothetical protein
METVHKEDAMIMARSLPKGHLSCLSIAFRYTPAVHTNVANTFARIIWELNSKGAPTSAPGRAMEPLPVLGRRLFPLETIESAKRLLLARSHRTALRLAA